jgi:hypothetical protein
MASTCTSGMPQSRPRPRIVDRKPHRAGERETSNDDWRQYFRHRDSSEVSPVAKQKRKCLIQMAVWLSGLLGDGRVCGKSHAEVTVAAVIGT